jgi:phosphoribosylformylglycinamidine synthase
LFAPRYGSILAEVEGDCDGLLLGKLGYSPMLEVADAFLSLNDLQDIWETTLEEVYPTQADTGMKDSDMIDIFCSERSPLVATEKFSKPRAVIPVFPGTNCEYDTANACIRAGIEPEIVVVRNLDPNVLHESADALAAAIGRSQMMILPGGFSGGDEPDGSAKFIVSFLRNPKLTDAVHDLLKHRDGLMLGICNGFQALVKLGLVPYGEIRQTDDTCPTLTFNLIGRHQSRYVTTRVASVKSPWMLLSKLDDMHTIPVSHGEGRFVAPDAILADMIANGQVATQYTDTASIPSLHISANPNGSVESIEGIFSPDGRVFGKMGHSERRGEYIAKNIPGNKHQPIFESGALYFK